MRTTIRLDENLLAEAKRYAAESGRTLTTVIEDALRTSLARRTRRSPKKPLRRWIPEALQTAASGIPMALAADAIRSS
jgi:predicted transcriptional regulator